jgi:hypothetical protein
MLSFSEAAAPTDAAIKAWDQRKAKSQHTHEFYETLRGLIGTDIFRVTATVEALRAEHDRKEDYRKRQYELVATCHKMLLQQAIDGSKMGLHVHPASLAPSPDAPSPDAPSPDAPSPDAPSPDAPPPDAPPPDAPLPPDAHPPNAHPAAARVESQLVLVDEELLSNMRDVLRSESGGTFYNSTTAVERVLKQHLMQRVSLDAVRDMLTANILKPTDETFREQTSREQTPDQQLESQTKVLLSEEVVAAMLRVEAELASVCGGKGGSSTRDFLIEKHPVKFATAVAAVVGFDRARSGVTAAFTGSAQLATTATKARVAVQVLSRTVGRR